MEETISTTLASGQDETTYEVVENETTQPVEKEQTTEENTTNEPQEDPTSETEIEQQPKNWEQIAKDNQAAFTRVSQELSALKKAQEVKYIDERGKITPEYEQSYRFELDNHEFLIYDQLARQLEPNVRTEVENLLIQAKNLYNPNNKTGYEQKMLEVKNYFDAQIVEQIALNKHILENKMQSEFDILSQEHKNQRAKEVAEMINQSEDLKTLLYQDSDNYSPEVFQIVQQMFDNYGTIDIDLTTKAIETIKSLGVKEYLVKQEAQKQKENASVPDGENLTSSKDDNKVTFDKLLDVEFWDKHYS